LTSQHDRITSSHRRLRRIKFQPNSRRHPAARHDLLEILEECYGRRSTIVPGQIPVDKWHDLIGDPTYADAILDRIVHNAPRINLAGHSMRRSRAAKASKE
jgi:DNA replication protein DnaC